MHDKVLVVIDVQKEYVTEGRLFNIRSIGPSLKNAKSVLDHARSAGWQVIHMRHLQAGTIFNPESEFSAFVEGFEPIASEANFSKNDFSCYSDTQFASLMATLKDKEIVVIGYGTTMCVLSTIIDGYHRGQKFTLVEDATAAKSSQLKSEEALRDHCVDILRTFAKVTNTASLASGSHS